MNKRRYLLIGLLSLLAIAVASGLWPVDDTPMVYIPPGEFLMGSAAGDSDEQPEHQVYLDGFWIDRYEVTNRQFRQFVDSTG